MKRLMLVIPSTLLICVILSFSASAGIQSYQIDLPTRSFTPDPDIEAFFDVFDGTTEAAAVVQLKRHINRSERQHYSDSGIHLQKYISGGAWTAYIEKDVTSAIVKSLEIRWMGFLDPKDKLSARVAAGETPPWAELDNNREGLAVHFMKPVSADQAEMILWNEDMEIGSYIRLLHVFYAGGDKDVKNRLAEHPQVRWISYIGPPMDAVNSGARQTTRAQEVQDPPYELSGQGVTVCVYDAGISDADHPDFEGRLTRQENGGDSDHPTHVAGSVGGNGADQYRGMAPEVTMVSYEYDACIPNCLYNSPQDIEEDYLEAVTEFGAAIATNSIGANIPYNGYPCEWAGDYEITSALLDTIVAGALGEDIIVTFAAGNDRNPDRCGEFYNTMGVPAAAKNVISVGATDDNDNMSSFSSWGPVDDGRIKPDVCAPGVNIQSCLAGGGHGGMSGTSMATPVTAGNVALMVETWHSYVADETPKAATIKAILCNSAEDLGNPGPDYVFGFGRIDAVNNIESIIQLRYYEDVVEDDGIVTNQFYVPAGLEELKTTLVWTDSPGEAEDDAADLINDLDIVLISPDGDEFLPFILDPENPADDATTGVNFRDNVEQVLVANPDEGMWSFRVEGTDIPAGPQEFSVAANVPLDPELLVITGFVTDIETGDPVEDAKVYREGLTYWAITDDEGFYTYYVVGGEDFTINSESFGYRRQRAFVFANDEFGVIRNFEMIPQESGTIAGSVDLAGEPAPNVTISTTPPTFTTTTDGNGEFSLDIPGDALYTVRASVGGLNDVERVFVVAGEITQLVFSLDFDVNRVSGPDKMGYIAIQSSDNHPLAPVYNWIEIDPSADGAGTRIDFEGEEDAVVVELPFTFRYYDQDYTEYTVNENGFFCFGDVTDDPEPADYSNSPLPDEDGPPALVAPFWEDMRAEVTNFSYYYDEAEAIYILEWYQTRQWPEDGTLETFQVILFDPSVHETHTGNGNILFQYADIEDLGNATVGIEDHTETDGIQILYFSNGEEPDGGYDPNAAEIVDESAILFTQAVGSLSGTVSLIPDGDAQMISVSDGIHQVFCDEDGNYSFPAISGGFQAIEFTLPGYEALSVGVNIEVDDNSVLDTELWALNAPLNVSGWLNVDEFDLTWSAPNHDELDEFLSRYKVYVNGTFIAEVEGTTYSSAPPNPDEMAVYWVTALYAGGESDTSNHVYYDPDGNQDPIQTFEYRRRYFELTSLHVTPPSLNAMDIFGDIPELSIVYQDDGGVVIPPFINTIGEIDYREGYQVFCQEGSSLTIQGPYVDPTIEFNLMPNRWNWLAFPFPYEIPVEEALSTIEEQIIGIQDDQGRIWIPGLVNSLGNLRPGDAYFTFTNAEVTFQYNDAAALGNVASDVHELPLVENGPTPTGKPWNVLVSLNPDIIQSQTITAEIYDGNILVGKGVLWDDEPVTPIVTWEGSEEHNLEGFTVGHKVSIVIRDSQGNKLPVRTGSDDLNFKDGAFGLMQLEAIELPGEFTVSPAYPNPFNPSVTVPFALPNTGEVEFKVFNLLGQESFSHSSQYAAGYHSFHFSIDQAQQEMGSGVYFLQAHFDGQVRTLKIMLLK